MQLHRLGKSLFGKAALATAALSGLLLFAGAPGAQAADRDDHRGGYFSRQVDRHEWREAYERSDRHFRYDRDRGFDRDRDGRFDRNAYRSYGRRFDRDRDRDFDRH